MKVLIAPDSFKGSISSVDASKAMERAVVSVFPDAVAVKIPIADGGEGTVDVFLMAMEGEAVYREVTGPMGKTVRAKFARIGNTAVIEMAQASGLYLVPENRRDPMTATTYGTGELIRYALALGAKTIILAVGGSATNDGGVGMAQALGASFTDAKGREFEYGCRDIGRLCAVNLSPMRELLGDTEVILASDVNNVLCGPEGTSHIYGPQKGADPQMVQVMDQNLRLLADVLERETGIDAAGMPGAGAAGGIAVPLFAIERCIQRSGIDIVLDMTGFDGHLEDADMVLTGEGQIDGQALYGKVLAGIGKRCMEKKVPVLAFAGSIGEDADKLETVGINAVFSVANGPMTLDHAMEHAGVLLEDSVRQVMKALRTMG
jgi:glycerate kinase